MQKLKDKILENAKKRIEHIKAQIDSNKGILVNESDYSQLPEDYKLKLKKETIGQIDPVTQYKFDPPTTTITQENIKPDTEKYTISETEFNNLTENNRLAYKKNWNYKDTQLYMLKVVIEPDDYTGLSPDYKDKFQDFVSNHQPNGKGHHRK